MTQEKTTIPAAAKALGVSQKTIYRYLSNGTLSRVREGKNTYILIDEIRTLRTDRTETVKEGVRTKHTDTNTKTITVKLTEYNELLKQIGRTETQDRYLLEYKATIEQKDKVILEQKEKVSTQNKILKEAGEKIRELQAENERLKLSWWKRLFLK